MQPEFDVPAEVRVTFDWTEAEIQRWMRVWHRLHSGQRRGSWLFASIWGWLVAISVCQVLQSGDIAGVELVVMCLCFPVLVFVFVAWRSTFPQHSTAAYAGSPDLNHLIGYVITNDLWRIEGRSFRTELQWSIAKSVTRVAEGIVVATHENIFRWLPIEGFESESAVETFVRMVESHGVKYDDRRRA